MRQGSQVFWLVVMLCCACRPWSTWSTASIRRLQRKAGTLWNPTVSSWSVCRTCNTYIAAHGPHCAGRPKLSTAYSIHSVMLNLPKVYLGTVQAAGVHAQAFHWQSSHTMCIVCTVNHMYITHTYTSACIQTVYMFTVYDLSSFGTHHMCFALSHDIHSRLQLSSGVTISWCVCRI